MKESILSPRGAGLQLLSPTMHRTLRASSLPRADNQRELEPPPMARKTKTTGSELTSKRSSAVGTADHDDNNAANGDADNVNNMRKTVFDMDGFTLESVRRRQPDRGQTPTSMASASSSTPLSVPSYGSLPRSLSTAGSSSGGGSPTASSTFAVGSMAEAMGFSSFRNMDGYDWAGPSDSDRSNSQGRSHGRGQSLSQGDPSTNQSQSQSQKQNQIQSQGQTYHYRQGQGSGSIHDDLASFISTKRVSVASSSAPALSSGYGYSDGYVYGSTTTSALPQQQQQQEPTQINQEYEGTLGYDRSARTSSYGYGQEYAANTVTQPTAATAATTSVPIGPAAAVTVAMRGWLQRRRGRVLKRWKTQYCLLKTDHRLGMYASEDVVNGRLEARFVLLRVAYHERHGAFVVMGLGMDDTPIKEELRAVDTAGWRAWFHALRGFFDPAALTFAMDRIPELMREGMRSRRGTDIGGATVEDGEETEEEEEAGRELGREGRARWGSQQGSMRGASVSVSRANANARAMSLEGGCGKEDAAATLENDSEMSSKALAQAVDEMVMRPYEFGGRMPADRMSESSSSTNSSALYGNREDYEPDGSIGGGSGGSAGGGLRRSLLVGPLPTSRSGSGGSSKSIMARHLARSSQVTITTAAASELDDLPAYLRSATGSKVEKELSLSGSPASTLGRPPPIRSTMASTLSWESTPRTGSMASRGGLERGAAGGEEVQQEGDVDIDVDTDVDVDDEDKIVKSGGKVLTVNDHFPSWAGEGTTCVNKEEDTVVGVDHEGPASAASDCPMIERASQNPVPILEIRTSESVLSTTATSDSDAGFAWSRP